MNRLRIIWFCVKVLWSALRGHITPYTLIVNERIHQLSKGYDSRHDDAHLHGELVMGACYFLLPDRVDWPWLNAKPDFLKLTYEDRCIKAAAMLVTELGRLERLR